MDASFFGQFDSIPVTTISADFLKDTVDREYYDLFYTIVARIKPVIVNYQTRVASSFGKDSQLMLSAALEAHIIATKEGLIPADKPFIVTNIDTGVDDIFVRSQIDYEVRELTQYCAAKGVNLVYRAAVPPVRYSWSVMYLSGMKLPSFAKSSADCSVILKIDPAQQIERSLCESYGDITTLLGVRSDESSRRSASIKRHNLDDISVVEKEINGKTVRTFAPIVDLDTDDVFAILRRSGTEPIVSTIKPIPTYKAHNKLLIKLYGDAKDTCPVTSYQPAAESKRGSCGTGSRFGCYTCLKVTSDKSANSRERFSQYDRVAHVKLIRDWMAHHADDMSLRTAIGKSLCDVTGSIVVQENTYSAETLEKLIWWFSMATREDYLYAENFKTLIEQGRLMENAGYAEIVNDPELDEKSREFYLSHYVAMSQEHLITPLTIEHIMMICAIHARDGVALPPYRALHIWDAVWSGESIAWPVISGEPKVDPVPEPRFYFGEFKKTVYAQLSNVLSLDEASCTTQSAFPSFDGNLHLKSVDVATDVKLNASPKSAAHAFTKRKIVSKRKGPNGIVIQKGRMSVAFRDVPSISASVSGVEKSLSLLVTTTEREQRSAINVWENDDVDSGLSIDHESLEMFLFTEYRRCLDKHDEFVARKDAVSFGGTGPFTEMVGYGVIALTARARLSSERMLARTVMLSSMVNGKSLLNMDREALSQFTVDQEQYRFIKSKMLLQIRAERHAHKKSVRSALAEKESSPSLYIARKGDELISAALSVAAKLVSDKASLEILVNRNVVRFDGVNIQTYLSSTNSALLDLVNKLGSINGFLGLLSMDKSNIENRKAAALVVNAFVKKIKTVASTASSIQTMWTVMAGSEVTKAVCLNIINEFIDIHGLKDVTNTIYTTKKPVSIAQLSIFKAA